MADAVVYPSWRELIVYSAGPQPRTLAEMGHLKAVLAGLEAGAKIPVHPEAIGMYHFLEGTGWMTVDKERYAVGPGTTIIVPDGAQRGIEAETRLAFVAARVT